MKCPNCKITAQRWEKKCLSCGIVFLEFYERRAKESAIAARELREEPPPAESSSDVSRGAWVALALGVFLSAWAASRYRGHKAPPGAFQDKAVEIVFIPPPGWKMKADLGSGWRFRRLAELNAPGGRIEVDSAPLKMPVESHLGELIHEEFNGRRPRIENPVHLTIAGKQGRKLAFSAENGPFQPAVVGEAVFIPGNAENYLIRFYSNSVDVPLRRSEWRTFLSSIKMARK